LIPLRDANPVRNAPIVNRILLAVNLVAWLYVVYLTRQPGALEAFYNRYSFDWLEFTRRITSGDLGVGTFIPLISHMFLHGGWLHVLGNMLYLWIFGDNIEDRFGSAQYLVFYLLCGIVAAIGQGLISPEPMVGASGAIAGVLAAYLMLRPCAKLWVLVFFRPVRIAAMWAIGIWVALQFYDIAQGEDDGVAYAAHLGGLAAGALLFFLLRPRDVELFECIEEVTPP
jgi:membrane associated rhomboid family serine protease